MSARGILDVLDMSADIGFYVRILEDTVAEGVEGAVLQHKVVGIAQQLLAQEVAVDESHVFRVPGQVLAVKVRVADSDILTFPERVLGDDVRIGQLHVLAVLEDIFRIALQTVDAHILTEHEGIGAVVQLQVAGLDVLAAPESLVGIVDDNVLEVHIVHLTKHLRTVDASITHVHVVAVPEGRARPHIELASVDSEAVDVPEGIFPPEAAVLSLNVRTLLDGALTIAYGYLLQSQVVGLEERTFALKVPVFDGLHIIVASLRCKDNQKIAITVIKVSFCNIV